jgi:hypothetical protein
MNAFLLLPVPFIFKTRLPPSSPPPLGKLLTPLRETPFLLILGGSIFMFYA